MKTYRAGLVQDEELRRELLSIERAAGSADPFSHLQYRHAEPERIRAGMLVLADGTDWDPGSGEGLYRRDKANAAWIFLG